MDGNMPALVYWAPEESDYVNTTFYIAADGHVLSESPVYGMSDGLPVTPGRLRYLGHATIDNGQETLHVFQLQPARSYPFDAALR